MRKETDLGRQSDAAIAVWEYRQFVADPVLWRRVEGAKDTRLQVERLMSGPRAQHHVHALGVAEIGENTVTHVLGDEAAVALNQLRAAPVIGIDNPP
jgi:hypothetical protein